MSRYDLSALTSFAQDLFAAAGVERPKADSIGSYLVLADAMGHDTHGLALATWYLDSIAEGVMTLSGEPRVLSDRGAAVAWDGRRLPGAWLTETAIRTAIDRAREFGTSTVAVGNAHHIGALAAYLELATDAGMMIMLASSSPSGAHVAPYGGVTGVFSPNPVAWGIPTGGDPILIDISASITTFNMAKRLIAEERRYPGRWVMDREGRPTDDPAALGAGGTLLPAGGLDHGQKGYGAALATEALTQGLGGHGRADTPAGTVCAFTVQVQDPDAFGGREVFLRQTGWLAEACRASAPHPDFSSVRLPGERALARRRAAAAEGVTLYPGVFEALAQRAETFGVAPPLPL